MGLQCVRHDDKPRADDTVEWGRGQCERDEGAWRCECERDEGAWRCESGAGLVRQRDLHMTRHGGCQESAAHTTREHAHVCCLHCAVDGLGSMCAHHMHFDDRTLRGTVAQSLLYYAITPRARPTATTPTAVCGLEVRRVAVETQSAVVHFMGGDSVTLVTLAHPHVGCDEWMKCGVVRGAWTVAPPGVGLAVTGTRP